MSLAFAIKALNIGVQGLSELLGSTLDLSLHLQVDVLF